MPVVWCSISAHGFGHAAQIIPILNELGAVVNELHVILRTCVHPSIFQDYLHVKWELQPVPQDVGCIQQGPLDIDIPGTWTAHQEFHENWMERVTQEAKEMNAEKANLVLSNISYLALAGANLADLPGLAIASLSWDEVLQPFIQSSIADHQACYEHIRREYAKAKQLIRLYPGIEMPAFPFMTEAGPSFPVVGPSSRSLKELLGISNEEQLVLIAFGGIPLTSLPWDQMESCAGFHFLVGGLQLDPSAKRVHNVTNIHMPFAEMMRQADVVIAKPGYATTVTAVHYGIPLVYVRRNNFVDEQSLVNYAHKFGRAIEMTRQDFESGAWAGCLQKVVTLPSSHVSPPRSDYEGVVRVLRTYLET